MRWPALVALLVSGCGSSTGAEDSANGSISARIDGQSWTSWLGVEANRSANVVAFAGRGSGYEISIAVGPVTGPGTFQFGVGESSTAVLTTTTLNPKTWTASLVGGGGSVTLTTVTELGAEGTFSFTGVASGGAATGNRIVTGGKFSVKF